MKFIKLIRLLFVLLLANISYAQVTHTVTLNPIKDVGVSSFFPSTGFNDTSNLSVGSLGVYDLNGNLLTYDIRRVYLQYDLSSIPEDALIANGFFKVYQYQNPIRNTTGNLGIHRALEPWEESGSYGITWNNQPEVSSGTPLNFGATATGWLQVQARDHVQKIVNGTNPNNGWMLYFLNEAASAVNTMFIRSNEYANQVHRPQLVVEYYFPLVVKNAVIVHQDGEANNGSISPEFEKGPGGTLTYKWYSESGAIISTSTSTPNLNNVPAGWYGLEVTSSKQGSQPFYTSFIVGKKCSDVSFNFYPGKNYMDDPVISTLSSNSTFNLSGLNQILESSVDDRFMLMKLHMWIPEDIEIIQGDLEITIPVGTSTSNSNPDNSFSFYKVNSPWMEDYINYGIYNTKIGPDPYQAINPILSVSATTRPNVETKKIIDARPLFNNIKLDNTNNHGWITHFNNNNGLSKSVGFYSTKGVGANLPKRPRLILTVRVIEQFETSWNPDTDKGKIFVDITGICDKVGPYHYFVSKDSIPSLDETYTILNDSLNFGIDSVQFFTGKEPKSTYSFEHLPADNYYVSVFDSRGLRIMNKQATVFPPIDSVSMSNGIEVISKTQVKGTLANSAAFLDMYLYNRDEGEMTFKLNSITQDTLTQYFGITNLTLDSIAWSNLAYGFLIDRGSLVVCSSIGTSMNSLTQTLTSSNAVINSNSIFKIKVQNGEISFFHNNNLLKSDLLPEIYDLKIAVGLKSDDILEVKTKGLFSKKFVRATVKITEYPTCSQNSGTFGFGVAFPNKDYISYTVTTLSNSTTVGSGQIGWNNQSTPIFSGYPAGIYQIVISDAVGGAMIETHYVYLGYQTEWSDVENFDFNPNTYSVERNGNNLGVGNLGHAKSVNLLPRSQNGWVKFTPKVSYSPLTSPIYYDMLRFTPANPTINEIDFFNTESGRVSFANSSFSGYNYSCALLKDASGVTTFTNLNALPFDGTKSYLIKFESSNMEFVALENPTNLGVNWLNGQRGAGTTRVRANTKNELDGFYDVVTSFGCPDVSNQFAILKYELDGYYHTMKDGQIRFVFNQEYANSILQFKIYDGKDQNVRNQSHYPPVNVTNGKNYVVLDTTTDDGCLGGKGFYYIEITNDKKEKFYLRFYNDFEDCTPTNSPIGDDFPNE